MSSDQQLAPLALVCAVALAMACILPFMIWGNAYQGPLLAYWIWYGTGVVALGTAAAAAPIELVREWPTRAAAILLRPTPRAFALITALLALVLAMVLSAYAFGRFASTSDEIAQLWHARILLSGHLALPADPNPEFFAIDNVIDTGSWYSHFPIGGPLALLPGVAIGAPWVINPLFAAGSVACLYVFARQAFGDLQGRVVTLLFALTPGLLMMAGTYMNHVPTLFLATAVLAATAQWEKTSGRAAQRWAAAIGLSTGLMATVRPLDAVVAALVIGLFQLRVAQQVPRRAPELLWTIVGGIAGVAPLLYANWSTNGSAFRFGYDVMWGEGHRIGLHADPRGNEHTLTRAVGHAVRYVSELNFSAMAWPLPALAIAFVSLTAMLRTTRWDALVFGWGGAQVVAYGLYWGEGEFLGPRFLFTVLPMLVIVLARAPFILAERSGPAAGRGMATVIALCMLVTWFVPAGLYTLWGGAGQVKATRQFLRLDVRRAVADARATHALVFVREPFSGRLLKRMWGVGVPRGEAASLMASSDACSLVDGVRAAELDTGATREARAARVRSAAVLFQQGPQLIRTRDPQIKINSMESISPACRAEVDGERYVSMSFGAALPHERIMPNGSLGGNIVYAADLGEHNEVLRGRFGDRTWYRLEAAESSAGVLRAKLVPY